MRTEESVKRSSISSGEVIIILLREELVYSVHLSPSLSVLQLDQRVVGILSVPICGERMLRSQRESLTLAVIFMNLLAVSQRSIDVWIRPGAS